MTIYFVNNALNFNHMFLISYYNIRKNEQIIIVVRNNYLLFFFDVMNYNLILTFNNCNRYILPYI